MKFLGIFFILAGIVGIWSSEFFLGIFTLLCGVFIFSQSKKTKTIKTNEFIKKEPVISEASTIISSVVKKEKISFRVAGISKKNNKGENIQKLIRDYVVDEVEMIGYKYQDMTNKEILEDGEDVYEADIYGSYEITLELEPNNPYDSNAIKVIHDEIGHIGYVPKGSASKVKTFIENNCDLDWKLVGGKLKYVDWDDDKVKIKTLFYGIEIELSMAQV